MITVTFDPDAELDPGQLEEAVRAVDFTPTGVRAWIQGHVLEDETPTGAGLGNPLGGAKGATTGGVIFEATGTGQRFFVTTNPDGNGASIDELRDAAGSVLTLNGRAMRLEGIDEVVIYLEGIGGPR